MGLFQPIRIIVSTWIIAGLIYSPALITRGLVEDGNITEVNESIFVSLEDATGLYHWFDMFFRFFATLIFYDPRRFVHCDSNCLKKAE